MDILIYSPLVSTRLQYTTNIIFKILLNIEFRITNNKKVFLLSDSPKINYSQQKLTKKEVFIYSHSILFEKKIRRQSLVVHKYRGLFTLFNINHTDSDLPFDLFAMVFYLISRYEEYLPFDADTHDRFTAKQSIAYQYDFLKKPVINQWVIRLKELLEEKFNHRFLPTPNSFCYLPTYDIDMAWAYRHRNWKRTIGAYAQDVVFQRWGFLSERFKVHVFRVIDPFYTFDDFNKWHASFSYQPLFFFLLGDYGKYDKNVNPENTNFRQLIYQLHKQYQTGIHPSYSSNISFHQLSKEIKRLEEITQEKVQRSRQHFLKLHLPQTYQNLIKAGITADYSMGYAEDIGFRASIATPFPWYDLQKEKETKLIIYPFQIMDVTLQQYLKLSPDEALEYIKPIIQVTKEVKGTLVTLWHNSSFSATHGWSGWRVMYKKMWKLLDSESPLN